MFSGAALSLDVVGLGEGGSVRLGHGVPSQAADPQAGRVVLSELLRDFFPLLSCSRFTLESDSLQERGSSYLRFPALAQCGESRGHASVFLAPYALSPFLGLGRADEKSQETLSRRSLSPCGERSVGVRGRPQRGGFLSNRASSPCLGPCAQWCTFRRQSQAPSRAGRATAATPPRRLGFKQLR